MNEEISQMLDLAKKGFHGTLEQVKEISICKVIDGVTHLRIETIGDKRMIETNPIFPSATA